MRKLLLIALLSQVLFSGVTSLGAAVDLKVSGLGLFGNLDMERRLRFLSGATEGNLDLLDPRELEDKAYIVLQQLRRGGYPAPSLTATITFEDETSESHAWTIPFTGLPGEIQMWRDVKAVRLDCDPGQLNYYRSVNVAGITSISEEDVQAFFLPSGVLFTRKANLAFTENNLNSRIGRLIAALHGRGFLQTELEEQEISTDPETGATDIHLVFSEGPVHRTGKITTRLIGMDGAATPLARDDRSGELLNYQWLREYRQTLLNSQFSAGFPDAKLSVNQSLESAPEDPGTVLVNLDYQITPGERQFLSSIQFIPEDLLKGSILRRTVDLQTGQPFDLLAVEEGRRDLLSLGVLNDVDLEQTLEEQDQRTATYTMTPLPRRTLLLKFGWGSYERARAGLNWEHLNLWNRAHRYEFDLEASTKSANVELTYVIPHFFDKRITGYVKAGHEFREEISYDRTTTTFLLGATRRLEKQDIELSVEYSLERQDADRDVVATFSSTDEATVSSLTLRAILDRRDNVLYPTSGYDFTAESKSAHELLGGNANFQKMELSASYHKYLIGALYMHLSLRYGGIFSRSPASENLPFNERFFNGGENTIRGYQKGEASPKSPEGQLIGAESFVLANVELEQRIFSNLSVILFWDGLSQSTSRETIPDNEFLNSVGLGLRMRTPVGPIRIEYGHNLNPRPSDPEGTLHFAIGYPF